MNGSFLKHTNVELLRLATYLARRDVAVGQIQRCNIPNSSDVISVFDESPNSQVESQDDKLIASLKTSMDIGPECRESAHGSSKTSRSMPLSGRTRSELSSTSHSARKAPPISARSVESLPRRTFSPPVRDRDVQPPSRRKPLHEPTERRLMAAEVSRLRQLIMKSKRALECLDTEILARRKSGNLDYTPRLQPLPLSDRSYRLKTPPKLVRLRPKSAKTSLLKPCAVPLKSNAHPPRKHGRLNAPVPAAPRSYVHSTDSGLRRPSTAGHLANSPTVSAGGASLLGNESVRSSRSELCRPHVPRGRSPHDMALLSSYLKRLSTGSPQSFDGSATSSPKRQPLPSNIRPTGRLKHSSENQDRSSRPTPRPLRQKEQAARSNRVEEEFVAKWGRRLDYIEVPSSPSILRSSLSADESVTLVSQDSVDVFINRYVPPSPVPKRTLKCKPREDSGAEVSRNAQFSLIPNEDDARLLQPQFNNGLLFTKRPMEAGDASQWGRSEQPNRTASATATQQVLRLPDSLHKRLLAGSSKAQAAHRTFWQAAGLQETSTGVCLHSVFDWLVQDLVGTCVDGVVNSLEAISEKLIDNLLKQELDSSSVENSETGGELAEQTRKCEGPLISTTRGGGGGSPVARPCVPFVESRVATSATTIAEGDFELSSQEVTPVPFDQDLSRGASSQSSSVSCLALSLKNDDADEIEQEVPEEICTGEITAAPDLLTPPADVTEASHLQSSLRSEEQLQELAEQSAQEVGRLELEEVHEDLPSSVREVVVQDELSSSAPKRAVCVTSTPRQLELPMEPEEVDVYSADFDESRSSHHSADSVSRSSSVVGEVNWGSRTSSGASSPLSISIAESLDSEDASSG